ncbi:MAG: hypothetical protein ACYDEV_16030 [Acidiferrobacter sp.]
MAADATGWTTVMVISHENAAVANPSLRQRIVCIPVITASASNLKPVTYFLIESLPMKRLTQF